MSLFWRFRRAVLRAVPMWLRLPPALWPLFMLIVGLDIEEMIRGGIYLTMTQTEVALAKTLTVAIFLYALVLFLAWIKSPKKFEVCDK